MVPLIAVPDADVLPLPGFGLPAAGHAAGILPGQEGGSYLVLDGAAPHSARPPAARRP
ncbi:hypothetical protein [Dactylosporangium sp. NPDC000521]|uniref:hypothetical protein n=1 Tax=Dactylosporangium sp. NPDC000521 TaxID=3363975 RepID=UPI00367E1931